MEGGGIALPDAGAGDIHGTKRARSGQEDLVPRSDSKQGRSRNRTRRHQRKNLKQVGANTLIEGIIPNTESHPTEPSSLSIPGEKEYQEVIEDDELDFDDEDGADEEGEDAEGGEEGEDKPRELTAAMKKKLTRLAKQIQKEAGHAILTLDYTELSPTPFKVTWNEDDIKLLCSYNWQGANDGTNTIFVPGSPAMFYANKTLPQNIETDSGFQARDYNYVRKPRDPFSPLFTALGVMNPGYQFWDVDVLADRNNLRILLEFVQGKANGPLRLDVHMVYNTLVLVRKGEKFWQRQKGGIGNNFEKMFTQVGDGMEDATSHYRAIRYPMGPLEVVVRFEADAYFDEEASDKLASTEAEAVTGALLAERPQFDFRPPMQFLQKGHIVPMAQMAELKTVTHKEDGTDNVRCQDQLWFGRTSHLFTGIYQMEDGKGKILRVKYENAKGRVDKWEEKNQEGLRKLVDLLTRIRTVLKQQDGPVRAGVLVRESKDGPVVLRTMLKKSHIIGREFFATHWDRSRSHVARNHRGAGRSFQIQPQPGMGGYRAQSRGMRHNHYQPHPGGSGGCGNRPNPSYGAYNPQQQHGSYAGYHHPYSGDRQNTQQPVGYGGNQYQSHNGYGGYNVQQLPATIRGDWNGGRGTRPSRGPNESRSRDRGRGYDPNYGRSSRDS